MAKKKTLFLFNDFEESQFFELEGDYSHLDGVFINSTKNTKKQNELLKLVYDDDGNFIVEMFSIPTKDWTHFVSCGVLP